jgi:hypothetical protein
MPEPLGQPADGTGGILGEIIGSIPEDYSGDRMQLAQNTLNHRVLSERDPVGTVLADLAHGETRRAELRRASEDAGNALLIQAERVDQALAALHARHSARAANDPRCKTCRTSSGKPAPWPCEDYLLVLRAGGREVSNERIAFKRALGAWLNARTDGNLARLEKAAAALDAADARDLGE